MKGPGLRAKYDVQRIWKCPVSGRIIKTPVYVTSVLSPYVQPETWMKLLETQRYAIRNRPLESLYSSEFLEANQPGDEARPPAKNPRKRGTRPGTVPLGQDDRVDTDEVVTEVVVTEATIIETQTQIVVEQVVVEQAEKPKPSANRKVEDFENGIFDGPSDRPSAG